MDIRKEIIMATLQTVGHWQVYLNPFKNQNVLIYHELMQISGGESNTKRLMLTTICRQNFFLFSLSQSTRLIVVTVQGRILASQRCPLLLIPRICECFTWCGKRDFENEIKLRNLSCKDFSELSQVKTGSL